ncbi:unnamed protein product [Trichobilharzia szidati]|nr:unnamed protein product [Trichobilharzia szidati]
MHVVDPELDSQESLDDNIVNSSVSSTTDDDSYSRNVHSLSSFNLQPRDGNYGKYKKQLDCNLRIGSAYYIGTTINPNFNLSTDEQHKTMKEDVVDKTARSQAFLRNPFNLLLAREQGDIGASSKSRRLRYRATRWITEGHQRYNGLQIYGNRCKGVLYPDAQTFQENIQGSLWAVNRLHLENKFECHHGCVNALNFNSRGNLIASGSDDLRVVITNWMTGEQMWNYRTGHSMNIFHVKFIPESNDLKIVSCACDSEVRLALLSPAGGLAGPTRLLAKHTRACHKLSIPEGEPNIVLSAGADGRVFSSDVRTSVAHKILHLAYSEFFSIASNPVRSHEFALCGRSESVVRIYDRRKVSRHDPKKGLLHTFGVDHLRANSRRQSTTTTTNTGGESQFSHRVTMNSRTSRRRHLSGDSDSDSDSDRNLLSSLTAQLGHGVRAVLSALGGRARAALLSGNTNDSSIPSNLADDFDLTMYSVTAAVYSPQGDAILLSYNDDDIYLFDVNHLDKPYLHKYSGHRNMQTIVGATFFGPNGEYIVSGSDDGYFYLWDRESEGVAQWLHADIGGAVNIIESHPTLPVLASAGLDYDFKIWSPIRPLYAEEDETFTHLKYSTTRINSDVQRLRKSKLAKAFFPNNDFINNTTNNSNTEMESLRKLLSDKTNGISISIDSLTSSSSSPSSPSSPSSLTSPSSCSISSTTSPSSSSSSSLSTSDEEMTSTTTNHHIDECDDIKNSKKQKQMPYEFINTSTEEYSVDMDSASSSSATAAAVAAAAVYTLSKSRKRRHPNTDMIFNEDIEAGGNNVAHNGDYCTEQNDEMLQVDNNTNNIDHNDNNNNNTIKQEMNGISSEIINPQESPPLSKQPKRSSSSSQVLPTCSTSSTIPNNKQELTPCKIQENDDKTIKETAKNT